MKKLVVLTGAGISAESGLKTFRDSDGLWENYRIEEVATPQAWKKDPSFVQEFYNLRRKQILEALPNKAHFFLHELEKLYQTHIITQNIDDLHERAGSTNTLHLHGLITLAKSSGPNQEKKYYPINGWELKMTDLCDDGFELRPHVVWFGEEVPNLSPAANLVSQADFVLIIGTSLQVYPAAGLIHHCPHFCKIILVDPNANRISNLDKKIHIINKTAVKAIPDIKKELNL
ncbi:MAG: NAD-dependent deacylase [Flavobacteriia bacterium]|nr:NAD-dependent deacylase [Flavobacteriia bacterium]